MRHGLNRRQDRRKPVSYVIVRKSEYPISSSDQERLAFGIKLVLMKMHAAVKLDRKAPLDTAEVDHERTDGMLTPKLQPSQTTPAK